MITNKEEAVDHFRRQLERNQFGESIHAQAIAIAVECMETTVAETMAKFREFIKNKPLGIDREYQTFLIGINGSWEDAIEEFVKKEENR